MTYEHESPNEWTIVTFNLPPVGPQVLVFGKNGFDVARLDEINDEGGSWLNSSEDYLEDILYWMELPQHPEIYKGKSKVDIDEFGNPVPPWMKGTKT